MFCLITIHYYMPSLTNLKTLKTVTEGNYTESVITFQISGGKNFGTDEKKTSFRNEYVPMIFAKSFLNTSPHFHYHITHYEISSYDFS